MPRIAMPTNNIPEDYLEPIGAFLAADDVPAKYIIPELLPAGAMMLVHGEPRARKSLAAFELALSAATGTTPFGLSRLELVERVPAIYVMEEDGRELTRTRLQAIVRTRCGDTPPDDTLHVAVRRGVNLDDPVWVERLILDIQRLDVKLLVLDAARRVSAKTDEGPAKVRELISVLRAIVTITGVAIIIVHHDTKPPQTGQDQRRRSQRASGGDWFAACECPVHVERIGKNESLVFPEDYKHTADPVPFTFTLKVEGKLVTSLIGADMTKDDAERAGVHGKVLDWLAANGPATKTSMKKAGLGRWETIEAALEVLQKSGRVDSGPGRKAGSHLFFVAGEPSPRSGDDSSGAAR
jgi:hypothetical protein